LLQDRSRGPRENRTRHKGDEGGNLHLL
ncbi:uncharacterized protein METZ01_LOCUS256706, partial [marine metagenome]